MICWAEIDVIHVVSPALHTKRRGAKTDSGAFFSFSLFFLLHLSFFVSAPQLNANSPGDSFLSVKDENERRKKDGGGGCEGGREGERRAENKTG